MAEKELILISHGGMAAGLKESIEMIMGKQDHVHVVKLLPGESPEDFQEKFEKEIAPFNLEDITVFADLLGGTPANTVSRLIMTGKKIQLYAGMNLPMVVEWLNAQMAHQATDYALAAQKGITKVNEVLDNQEDDF